MPIANCTSLDQVISWTIGRRVRPGPNVCLTSNGSGPKKYFKVNFSFKIASNRFLLVSKNLATIWDANISGWQVEYPDLALEILQLALDGALEINMSGKFLSGTSLLQEISYLVSVQGTTQNSGRLPELAYRGLQIAQAWPVSDHYSVVGALYFFNRLPMNTSWRLMLPDSRSVEKFLKLDSLVQTPSFLSNWQRSPSEPDWGLWRSRSCSKAETVYKLYVSVHPDALTESLHNAVTAFGDHGAHAFKVGLSPHGVLRPDSLLGYFSTLADLEGAARALSGVIDPSSSRGAPFSAPLDDSGVLSWGLDPKRGTIASAEGLSWRLWICGRLAHGIQTAVTEPVPCIPPADFARLRLPFWGVDPGYFGPLAELKEALQVRNSTADDRS